MKITSVDTFLLSLPYQTIGGFHYIAGRPSNSLSMLLIRINTDDGLSGWGEAFGHAGAVSTKAMLDSLVAPLIINEFADNIDLLMDKVRRKVHLFGLSGAAIYAISGLDIALWDLRGKYENKPVYELIGGRNKEISVYASFLRCSSDENLVKTCEDALSRGYKMVKLHEITYERIALARHSLGLSVELAVDTNCPWSIEEAKLILKQVKKLGLKWVEEPLWPPDDYIGLQKLRGLGSPISAGENTSSLEDFRRLLLAGAVDVLQPSVCKVGGITEMIKIIKIANEYGVTTVPHCGYMGPGYLTNLHLIAGLDLSTSAERLFIDLDEEVSQNMPIIIDGKTTIPTRPGIGFEPNMAIVKKFNI